MPFTDADKITNDELSQEVKNKIGITITKAEWLAKIQNGEIDDNTETVYNIIDDYDGASIQTLQNAVLNTVNDKIDNAITETINSSY